MKFHYLGRLKCKSANRNCVGKIPEFFALGNNRVQLIFGFEIENENIGVEDVVKYWHGYPN